MSLSDDEALFDDIYGDNEAKIEETKTSSEATNDKEEVKEQTQEASTTEEVKKEEEENQKSRVEIQEDQKSADSAAFESAESKRKADLSRDAGKMFVGGLDWDTSEEKFKEYFSKFGEVIDHTIMRDSNGRSRGFGFLSFSEKGPVDEVLKSQHILDGKVIDPKRAIPREEQDKTGKIFVGGIAPEVRPHEFEAFFSKFGSIIDAQLMLDKDTGRSRGFGFVTFDSPEAVDKVCVGKYLDFNGRQIEVKRAEPRGPQQQQNHIQQQQQRIMQQQGMMAMGMGTQVPNSGASGVYQGVTPEAMAEYWQQMQQYWLQVQQQQGASSDPNMAAQLAAYTQQLQQFQQIQQSGSGAGLESTVSGTPTEGSSNYDNTTPKAPANAPRGPKSFNNDNYRGNYRGGYRGGRGGRGRGNYRGGYNSRGGYHPYSRGSN
ncbi:hypothetical protein WICMUC_003340 [Wickerhamomyces mucosus]|uniref:RRM domain-containing protein n=1 Tax=Wickerhamomyces mucosus TaxID=1378264 RepID=A0A9P8PN40_9ASCO|nr:hypothetical protein WICMUC_003340 [Wickerhamomyces mucosus]